MEPHHKKPKDLDTEWKLNNKEFIRQRYLFYRYGPRNIHLTNTLKTHLKGLVQGTLEGASLGAKLGARWGGGGGFIAGSISMLVLAYGGTVGGAIYGGIMGLFFCEDYEEAFEEISCCLDDPNEKKIKESYNKNECQ